MMQQQHILNSIAKASKVIGKTWPLYSFVTSNPLSGYEHIPFIDAVSTAKSFLNSSMYPDASVFNQAWQEGDIKEPILKELLVENGYNESPETYLTQLESKKNTIAGNSSHQIDTIMAKWLAAFLDEGLAEWEMPAKQKGFYKAWRSLAEFDGELEVRTKKDIPKNSMDALSWVLGDVNEAEFVTLFSHHLAALPGWVGYINYRVAANSLWQKTYPISLEDYLGVRLWICKHLKLQIHQDEQLKPSGHYRDELAYIWLKAWEISWQHQLVTTLKEQKMKNDSGPRDTSGLEAQLVFCIDTRSELIRRHVESKGNYETFGYAGFFGLAMDYIGLEDGLNRKSCPPIVTSAYQVSEAPISQTNGKLIRYTIKNHNLKFAEYFLKRMKNMLPSAFGYVEGSGFFYGLYLLVRTLLPAKFYRFKQRNKPEYESLCSPEIYGAGTLEAQGPNIPLEAKVGIVKSAFDLTGWQRFAPVVLFVGHGSHSANNPFGSSLDCGACAASPGRHNARMLALLANEVEVRKALAQHHQINIPDTTIFVGAEHNTTTDEIVLFDAQVPEAHKKEIAIVKQNLLKAQETATQERLGLSTKSIAAAEGKANLWSETRPEWGLAKNAGFVVGPRTLTKNGTMDDRCFLHSYAWELDETGAALEGIMQGPMVVTQWINNHYYFSSVANDTLGGGNKITHNVTGRFGVVQGNGGDLKMGLPLQSLRASDTHLYHKPLRLSVLIQAPMGRVETILRRNENLLALLDNEWIYLLVMDPTKEDMVKRYEKGFHWKQIVGYTHKKVEPVGQP